MCVRACVCVLEDLVCVLPVTCIVGVSLSRIIFLQVSMNEGLSYITSSVHITTTECVSTQPHRKPAHGTHTHALCVLYPFSTNNNSRCM